MIPLFNKVIKYKVEIGKQKAQCNIVFLICNKIKNIFERYLGYYQISVTNRKTS